GNDGAGERTSLRREAAHVLVGGEAAGLGAVAVAADRGDVGIVAADGDGDVAVDGGAVVGGVEGVPGEGAADGGVQDLDPGVHLAFAFEVAGDVAGGEAGGAADGEHHLGEVLADAHAAGEG